MEMTVMKRDDFTYRFLETGGTAHHPGQLEKVHDWSEGRGVGGSCLYQGFHGGAGNE